jgi:hypothetical protein
LRACSITKFEITIDHFCQGCRENIMKDLQRNVPSLDDALALEGNHICDRVTNALKLANPNCFSITIPKGADGPFHGRILQADLDCVKAVEKIAVRVMHKLALENGKHGPLRLLVQLHCCVEQAEINLREEGILQLAYAAKVLQPFTSVMNLAREERECNICMEECLSTKTDGRREEKPCRLPCGHILGPSCSWEHFLANDFNLKMQICCSVCKTRFDLAEFVDLVKPEEVASSSWKKYISGGNTA